MQPSLHVHVALKEKITATIAAALKPAGGKL